MSFVVVVALNNGEIGVIDSRFQSVEDAERSISVVDATTVILRAYGKKGTKVRKISGSRALFVAKKSDIYIYDRQ